MIIISIAFILEINWTSCTIMLEQLISDIILELFVYNFIYEGSKNIILLKSRIENIIQGWNWKDKIPE